MGENESVRMTINGHELGISIVLYDNCHKIYIPVEGQEDIFIQSMEEKGWSRDEDCFKIESAHELLDMYVNSCPLRFIEQIDCSGDEDKFITIIPQCAFCSEDGFFDENEARKAFMCD